MVHYIVKGSLKKVYFLLHIYLLDYKTIDFFFSHHEWIENKWLKI